MPWKRTTSNFFRSLDMRSDRRANDFRELTARTESAADLDLSLKAGRRRNRRRAETPSMESETTTFESGLTYVDLQQEERSEAKLLRLF
ncbi:hypothetical protein Acr_10g0003820 [Actinidia rufa]|uniref:Uncharacterized protein n=1 Tax=Actinidia rufa TaxID=165716 RepID=A0A7J0FAS0_9ERIC|nr:hypothetical protein Acr_10g0003820 [Actinidia rufa]